MIHTADSFHPFDLSSDTDYQAWRAWKLDGYPVTAQDLLVPVADPAHLSGAEQAALLAVCRKANMAIYVVRDGAPADKEAIRALGRQFGLERLDRNLRADEDSITTLRVVPEAASARYIPYTSRPLNWHTDGYYNPTDEQVRAFVMHCVAPAASGGENLLLDPEIVYILMRDRNPDYIHALMQPDAMLIPANVEDGRQLRAVQSGPVFTVEKASNALHMRYTARTRSIEWKADRAVRDAIEFLRELLDSDTPWIIRHRLQAGQGLICNNVLHRREAFVDDAAAGRARMLYRARFYDRIRDTVADDRCEGDRQCCG